MLRWIAVQLFSTIWNRVGIPWRRQGGSGGPPLLQLENGSVGIGVSPPVSCVTATTTVTSTTMTKVPRLPGQMASLTDGHTHYLLEGAIQDVTAPVIVMLHGASMFSFCWKGMADLFAESGKYRILMLDFYGHGYSSVDHKMKITSHLLVQQLEELLVHLDWMPKAVEESEDVEDDEGREEDKTKPKQSHQLYLIGHSMGGLVASEFAAKHKEFVSKVILFSAAGLPVDVYSMENLSEIYVLPILLSIGVKILKSTEMLDGVIHTVGRCCQWWASRYGITYEVLCEELLGLDSDAELERAAMKQITTYTELSLVERSKALVNSKTTDITVRTMGLLSEKQRRSLKAMFFLLRSWMHQLQFENRASVMLSVLRNLPLLEADHSSSLEKILHIPTFIIWGEEDGLLPPYLLKKWKALLPHAEVLSLPETDHACFMQRPTHLFKLLQDFIEKEHSARPVMDHSNDCTMEIIATELLDSPEECPTINTLTDECTSTTQMIN